MSNSINTNIASLLNLNILNRSNEAVRASLQKVSSGLRINSAKDDAAGLAISNRIQSQINGFGVAVRNANDGISFAQTADSALGEISDSLTRIRELSLQASNATNSQSDRTAIQKEIDQLTEQVSFIAQTTTFNGVKVLNGGFEQFDFQIGASPSETVSVSRFDAGLSQLGQQPGSVQSRGDRISLQAIEVGTQGVQEGNANADNITDFTIQSGSEPSVNVAAQAFGGPIATISDTSQLKDPNGEFYAQGSAKSLAQRINQIREDGEPGFERVFASAQTTFKGADVTTDDYSGSVDLINGTATSVGSGSLSNGDLNINGVDIAPVTFEARDATGSLQQAINARRDLTGVSASVDDAGALILSAEDGRDIVIETQSVDVTNTLFADGQNRFDASFNDLRVTGRVTVTAPDTLSFGGTSDDITGFDDLSVDGAQDNVAAQGTLQNSDVTRSEAAFDRVRSIDSALQQIDSFRAELGAVQSRLDAAIRNLSNVQQSQVASRSRITDTDFAEQTALLTRDLVKQQAGIAIQAQANAQVQQSLQLLL